MSLRSDGRHRCDKCGYDLGNGDIQTSATVVLLDPASDMPQQLRLDFCYDRQEDGKKVKGCARRLTTDAMLADYLEERTPSA